MAVGLAWLIAGVVLVVFPGSLAHGQETGAQEKDSPKTSSPESSGQDVAGPEVNGPEGADLTPAGKAGDGDETPEEDIDPVERAKYLAEVERRTGVFKEVTDRLRAALTEQRSLSVRYLNGEEKTRKEYRAYQAKRLEVRDLMNETYLAALDLIRISGDPEAATFLATWTQNRLANDVYTKDTLEASTRLIDGGSKLTILFKAAARSAVTVGDFDLAKRLFEFIDDEQLEDADKTLEFLLDQYKEQFLVEQEIRKREEERDDLPRVKLVTTQGDVVLELFLDQAPSTVSHFIGLVEEKFYDELDFHQVIDHILALTGDPSGVGTGNAGKYLLDEHVRADARPALRGSLLMAKIPQGDSGQFVPNSASSQFAILFLPMLSATENQTVFGRVIEGMDAVSRLRRVDPNKEKKKGEIIMPPDRIIEATVIRRPKELPEPKYLNMKQQ